MKSLFGYSVIVSDEPLYTDVAPPLIFAGPDSYIVNIPFLRAVTNHYSEPEAIEVEHILREMLKNGDIPVLIETDQGDNLAIRLKREDDD